MNLNNKNILFILHSYNSFQKNLVESVSDIFKNVYVLVRYKPIAEINRLFPLSSLKPHIRSYVFDLKNKPENVYVFPVALNYLPIKYYYDKLGDMHFKKAMVILNEKKINFDIIHSVFTWTSGYVGNNIKKVYKKPHILTEFRSDKTIKKNISQNDEKIIRSWIEADHITTNNTANFHSIRSYNENTQLLYNGYSEELFFYKDKNNTREKLNIDNKKRVILTVGYLEEYKGHKYLIKALDKVLKNDPSVLCYIIGDGSKKSELQSMINKLNFREHIKLVGTIDHSSLNDWINACDIFVMPSLADGNPRIMFENLACGKPFIGTRVGDIPQVINSNDIGYLCNPADSDELSNKILEALKRNWDKYKISEHAKQYSWGKVADNFRLVYKNILN